MPTISGYVSPPLQSMTNTRTSRCLGVQLVVAGGGGGGSCNIPWASMISSKDFAGIASTISANGSPLHVNGNENLAISSGSIDLI